MPNPWLTIPLEEYEGHMSSPAVQQLSLLSELFRCVLDRYRPESVAILGVAGGNGLEQIAPDVTTSVIAIDINATYLEVVQRRFGCLPGLQLYCRDLDACELCVPSAQLVHAALIFEHTGLGRPLKNALSLIAPSGVLSVILQLPGADEQAVASTGYRSMQSLKEEFSLIDPAQFQVSVQQEGFRLIREENRLLPGGKGFWVGEFTQ